MRLQNTTKRNKDHIIAIYVIYMIIACLLFLALWLYANSEGILIGVNCCLSISLYFYYLYMKETLMAYTYRFFKKHPGYEQEIITDTKRRKFMKAKDYPMHTVYCCERYQLTDYYIAYLYILQSDVRICCIERKIKNFSQAYGVQTTNTGLFFLYTISVPIIQMIEYILEETGNLSAGGFNFSVLTRLYIVIITLLAILYIISYSLSFRKLLPFEPFAQQVIPVLLMQTSFNIIGALIRFTQDEMSNYNEFQTYQLLFICIYSCFFAIFNLLCMLISPDTIVKNEQKKEIIMSERTHTHEVLDDDRSNTSRTVNRTRDVSRYELKVRYKLS